MYCSRQCKDKHRGPNRYRAEVICAYCGRVFVATTKGRTHCSKACGWESRRLAPRACTVCGSMLQPNSVRDLTCSIPCAVQARVTTKRARPIEAKCERCGVVFSVATGTRAKYCGKRCLWQAANKRKAITRANLADQDRRGEKGLSISYGQTDEDRRRMWAEWLAERAAWVRLGYLE